MKIIRYALICLILAGCKTLDDGVTTETKGLPPPSKSVTLKWALSTGVVQGYKIEGSVDGAFFIELGTLPPGQDEVTVSNLPGGKKFYFRIRSFNQGGNSTYSPVIIAST